MYFSLGPRLVIPGAIFGCLCLALFLFTVTAGFTYPAAAQEPEVNPVTLEAQPETASDLPETPEDAEVDAVGGGNCELSQNFPNKILRWCDVITHYAKKRDLPPNLVAALILQESGGNPEAYSHSGAVGLMQVMPKDGLAASFMCQAGPCFQNRPSMSELQDPQFNVSYGTKMLSGLVRKHGDVREALKSYGPMDVGYYYADIVLGLYKRYGGKD